MAKPKNRQAKRDQKTKCEYFGCAVTFGRNSDRRRHEKEQHGPLVCCSYPGCEWTTRRMGKLRTHLNNVHHSQVSSNLTLLSEFRTTTVQPLASPNHLSTLDTNASFKFEPTTPPISTDYAITPQVSPDAFESHAALHSEGASTPEHNPTLGSSVAPRMEVKVAPYRIFRQRRVVRRRKSCRTARTPSTAPSQTHLGSDMESILDLYLRGQENLTGVTQWRAHTFNAESFASVLGSLSLLDSSIGLTESASNQGKAEPFELNKSAFWRDDTGDWGYDGLESMYTFSKQVVG